MQNARLDEAQAGIKIAGRNINNLRYAAHITLMEGSEELKFKLQTKITASGPITSWQTDGETVETVRLPLGAPKSLQVVTAAMKLKDTYSLEGKFLPA